MAARRATNNHPGPRWGAVNVAADAHFGVATYPPGATFGPRQMGEFEFVWMIAGDAEYRVDSQILAAPQGAFVLCQPGTVDEFTWDRRRRTQHGFIHFQIEDGALGLPPRAGWPVVAAASSGELLEPLFRHALGAQRCGDLEMAARAVEMMLIVFVRGTLRSDAIRIDVPPDPVARVLDYLYRSLDKDAAAAITLEDLSEAACVTPEHLCRTFKRVTGRSPMQVVRLARLDRAAMLLTRTNFAVARIAELCGFASQFHFARRFKAAFGAAPTAVRRDVRNGTTPPLPRLIEHYRPPEDQKRA